VGEKLLSRCTIFAAFTEDGRPHRILKLTTPKRNVQVVALEFASKAKHTCSCVTQTKSSVPKTLRVVLKRTCQGIALTLLAPYAFACAFGRSQTLFTLFANSLAGVPGIFGSFARAAFYRMTLKQCSIDVAIGYGTFFSRPNAIVGQNVSIGAYCIMGPVVIGSRTQIASHVEVLSGNKQHTRDAQGRLSTYVEPHSAITTIGEECWIGASCVVMADVGSFSTIGAGSIVSRPIPSGVIAVGSPAKPIKPSY
jgi:acetyltransferase-like isoleucine patch superfamily enzyme